MSEVLIQLPAANEKCIFSVMNPNASADTEPNLIRKQSDIKLMGKCLWMTSLGISKPESCFYPQGLGPVKGILANKPWIYFVTSQTKANAVRDVREHVAA